VSDAEDYRRRVGFCRTAHGLRVSDGAVRFDAGCSENDLAGSMTVGEIEKKIEEAEAKGEMRAIVSGESIKQAFPTRIATSDGMSIVDSGLYLVTRGGVWKVE
jgi:hypothetical protein